MMKALENRVARLEHERGQTDELPRVVLRFPDGVYVLGDERTDIAGFEAYRAKWEARGLPLLIIGLSEDTTAPRPPVESIDDEVIHTPPVFIKGAGVAKGPRETPEAWEARAEPQQAALLQVPGNFGA